MLATYYKSKNKNQGIPHYDNAHYYTKYLCQFWARNDELEHKVQERQAPTKYFKDLESCSIDSNKVLCGPLAFSEQT